MGGYIEKPVFGSLPGYGDPLSNGVIFAVLMNEGGGTMLNNPIGCRCNGLVGSGMTWKPGPGLSTGPQDGTDIITIASAVGHSSAYAVYVIAQFANAGEADQGFIFFASTGGSLLRFSGSLSDIRSYEEHSDTNTLIVTASSGITANTIHHICVTGPGEAGSTPKMYIDGADVGATESLASVGDMVPTTAIELMGNSAGSRVCNGTIYYFLMYNRVLSAYEVALLYRDPYRIFRRTQAARYAIGGAAPPAGDVVVPRMVYNYRRRRTA